jgi:cell division protein FtsI/penicillin-binding protein 2
VAVIERRIGLLFAAFVVLLAVGAFKAAWLGVVKAGTLKRAAVTQQEADIEIPARRGSITDAHGIDLAVSEPAVDVAATPYLVNDATKTAAKLAPLLDRPEDELLRQLARRDTGFVYLGRAIPAAKADRAEKLNLPGVEFIPRYRRSYPRDWMASQVLGSVGTDGQGLGGLEYFLDKRLRGHDGERRLVKDAMGNPIEMRDTRPVHSGASVRLTLDANLQDQAEQVLNEVGATWKPAGASAIVMDPDTGAILALANWPRVNANAIGDAPPYARTNRAIAITYEPGSTFKAMTVAAALEEGKVTPDTKFQVPPVLAVADRELHDAEDHGWETLTTSDILRVSSNIGAVLIARTIGTDTFDRWLHRWGFGKPTGIDLPGEFGGLVPDRAWRDGEFAKYERCRKKAGLGYQSQEALYECGGIDRGWSGGDNVNLSVGQGDLQATPLQLAVAYAAIANGGRVITPHLGLQVEDGAGRQLEEIRKPAKRRIDFDPTTLAAVREGLKAAAGQEGGTSADVFKGFPYTVYGKTGTAERGLNPDQSWYAAYVDDPVKPIVVVVTIEKGGFGAESAAPAARQILSKWFGVKDDEFHVGSSHTR